MRGDARLIVCAGLDHIAVVETADAVLVADMTNEPAIKAAIDSLRTAGREEAVRHLEETRPWGSFRVLLAGDRFKIKEIVVNPGAQLSLQSHVHRSEHWVVLAGTARVTCDDWTRDVPPNESTYIPVGAKHRLENPGVIPLRIVEVQVGDYVGEDDITRYDDAYGRAELEGTS